MSLSANTSAPANAYLIGALFVLAAGLTWSFTGIFTHLAPDTDAWQFLTYRCIGTALVFVLINRLQGHGSIVMRFFHLGWMGLLVSLAFAVSATCFIVAMKTTTVANALFLSSCSPILSAVLGRFVLGEKLNGLQLGAVILGFIGLAVIMGGGIEAGNLAGNICAFVCAVGFALASLGMRSAQTLDFLPSIFGYGVMGALFAASMCVAHGTTLLPPLPQILAAFAAGFIVMGLGFRFFLRGAQHVPAVGQTVLAQTETVFGPIWVWLIFGERPTDATLVGGVIILIAVIAMAYAGAKPQPPNVAA
ncbi:DMT family transporter [Methylovirgula sp. 4M-Z18]|uniref:DMT family transporter n=1 Tax=Methylovirgula sp. 4M-Z18 TaxID=2293567 RepID=UPI0013140D88|nr:DMT family transporter [Methylovirgula sp. 4M-Z18]